MTHVLNTATAPSFGARLRATLDAAKTAWALRQEYKRTYAELASLSDRDLNDISIRRCDIADIARVHVYGA